MANKIMGIIDTRKWLLVYWLVLASIVFSCRILVYSYEVVDLAKEYEQNLVDHHKGIPWNYHSTVDIGDTSDMTEEEILALEKELSKYSSDQPRGISELYKFKYYEDILTGRVLQYVEIDNILYIVSWDTDGVVHNLESWRVYE